MAETFSKFRPNLEIFGVRAIDPGWIYMIRNGDLVKIGKTINPKKRIYQEAMTWIPDLEVLAVKPCWGVSYVERTLHVGLTEKWHYKEWFNLPEGDPLGFLISDFQKFYDEDRDMNSVDFIYWVNSSGMAEWCRAMSSK